jgi:hypothetical protein
VMAKFTKITDPAQLNEALDVYEKAWERIPMPPCDASDYTQPNCSGLKIRCPLQRMESRRVRAAAKSSASFREQNAHREWFRKRIWLRPMSYSMNCTNIIGASAVETRNSDPGQIKRAENIFSYRQDSEGE